MVVRAWVWALCSVALAACDDGGGGGTDTTPAEVSPDASQDAVQGALTLVATFADGAPKTGQNRLTITVTDDHGGTVEGATLTVVPTMPMMGHGSTETPVVTEQGAGVYEAFPLTFQMPGAWNVAITAQAGGAHGQLALDVTVGR